MQNIKTTGDTGGMPTKMAYATSALIVSLLSACGGATNSATVPDAPTDVIAAAGDASARLSFTAPASDGGATISSYRVNCSSNDGTVVSATGSASPVTVMALTNEVEYGCTVAATNSVGTGAESTSATVTPLEGAVLDDSTQGVACDYNNGNVVNPTLGITSEAQWSCDSASRTLISNAIPEHAVGIFPNPGNPNTITEQSVSVSMTLLPSKISETGSEIFISGYALNGIKMEAATAGTCGDTSCSLAPPTVGSWNIEALGQSTFDFGVDENNAHVQPNGEYHYHGIPEGFLTTQALGESMTLVGWAYDGFPIYARYGYSDASNAESSIKVVTSSWQTKATPDAGRPSTDDYPMGAFTQDYEYVTGLGDLDECNGRFGVTPEFPGGIYHYYMTDSWPYIQRCVKGTASGGQR